MINKTKKTAVMITIFTILIGISHAQIQKDSELLNTENHLHFQTETPLRSHYVGFPIEKKIVIAGGLSPYNYSILDNHLPDGIILSDEGILSGTARTISRATFTIGVNDQTGQTIQETFTIDFLEQLMIQTNVLDNAIAGKTYNQQILATGGSQGDYHWKIVSNDIPEGMQLDPQSGMFSGIPQKSGKYMITVVVEDSDGHTSTKRFPFRVVEPLQIKSLVMPSGLVGEEYSELIQISGGVGPYTFGCSDSLPEGLSFDSDTGIIEGVAAYSEYREIIVCVRDNFLATPQYVEEKVRISFNEDFRFLTNSVLPEALQDVPLNEIDEFVFSIIGGISPYTFEIIKGLKGGLPAGVDIKTGYRAELLGIPKEVGTFTFTLQARDAKGAVTYKQFFWHIIEEIDIMTHVLPTAELNQPYHMILKVKGGTPPYEWSVSSGNIPNGLELINDNNEWAITGIPIEVTAYELITFKVEDSHPIKPYVKYTEFYFNVYSDNLTIATDSLPDAKVGMAYEARIEAKSDYPPFHWRVINGTLPPGLTLEKGHSVLIKGKAEEAGNYPICFDVSNSYDHLKTVSKCFQIEVHDIISIETETLDEALRGKLYHEAIHIKNNSPYVSCFLEAGVLPEGLELDQETCIILGIPDENALSQVFSIKASKPGEFGSTDQKEFIIIVRDDTPNALPKKYTQNQIRSNTNEKNLKFITKPLLKSTIIGYPYKKKLIVSEDFGDYTFEMINGHLPEGIVLSSRGLLEGMPEKIGEYSFNVRVTDSLNQKSDDRLFYLEVIEELFIENEALVNALIGQFYKIQFNAIGGLDSQLLWEIPIDSIPKGMILDKYTGEFYGVPKEAKKSILQVIVRDNDGHKAKKSFVFHVVEPLKIKSLILPPCHLNKPYNEKIKVTGGIPPYTFECLDNLPDHLSFDPKKGIVSGLAPLPGRQDVKISVKDSFFPYSQQDETIITIIINENFMFTTNSSLPDAMQNRTLKDLSDYEFTIVGGTLPYSCQIIDGSLPKGVILNTNLQLTKLTGTPEEPGNYRFTLQATESNGEMTQKTFNWQIIEELTVLPRAFPSAIIHEPYREVLKASGGKLPYKWIINKGNLPDGLQLVERFGIWAIDGVPVECSNNVKIDFMVSDSQTINPWLKNTTINFNVIENNHLTLTTKNLPDCKVGMAYRQKIEALHGHEPYTWILHESLPKDFTCTVHDTFIWIEGKTEDAGTFYLNVQVLDSDKYSEPVSKNLTLTVHDVIRIDAEEFSEAIPGQYYTNTILNQKNIETVRCEIINGTLPKGLEIDHQSCTISGTPEKYSRSKTFCIKATKLNGNYESTDEKYFSIIIVERPVIITSFIPEMKLDRMIIVLLKAIGGIKPYHWFRRNGYLPVGMETTQEKNEFFIHGIPSQCGSFHISAEIIDSSTETKRAVRDYEFEVICDEPFDYTQPTTPNISKTFPGLDQWGNGIVTIFLTPGEDNESGICGYSYCWSTEKETIVDNIPETDKLQITSPFLPNGEYHYFHVASVDNAGNTSETFHYGPFKVIHPDDFILIVGGGVTSDPYWNITKQLTINAYKEFRIMGYSNEQIDYHIQSSMISIDHDDIPDNVIDDNTPSSDEIIYAIRNAEKFVNENFRFFFYIHAPGTDDSRLQLTNLDKYISAQEIDNALDWLQIKTNCEVIVIIDSCFSGNFIKELSGEHRIILTSAGDEKYNTDSQGQLVFSKYLFLMLKKGKTLKESYDFARLCMLEMGLPEPKMDDTGDGIYDEHDALENGYADRIILNVNGHQCSSPKIEKLKLNALSENHYQIEASLYLSDLVIKEVFVQVIPPNNDIYKDCSLVNFPKHMLTQTDTESTYQTQLHDINQTGTYKLIFHAMNQLYELSDPLIYLLNIFKPGDINGDNLISLQDAIIALKATSKLLTLNEHIQEPVRIDTYRTIELVDIMFILNELSSIQQ